MIPHEQNSRVGLRSAARFAPFALFVLLCSCAPGSQEQGRPVQADKQRVELLFTDPFWHATPGDRCEVPICVRLLEFIQGAQSSIDFAVYGMRHQTQLLDALVAAQARGVVVRGVVDRDRDRKNYYTSTDLWVRRLNTVRDDFDAERLLDQQSHWNPRKPACPRPAGFKGPLQCLAYDLGDRWLVAAHAGREPFDESTRNRIMHNKFFIVDRRRVWTGSCNLSDSGTGGYNANVAAVIDATQLAEAYTEEFEQMWAGRYHALKTSNGVEGLELNGVQVEVWFSPQDKAMRKGVQPLIAGAQQRIDLAVFYLTNKFVTAKLIAAHGRGVDIRVIIDATSAQNEYSKHELLRTAGIPVKVENWGGKMHMKAAAIDGRTVVVGSMNWTSAGESENDENTLVLKSPQLAATFESFFDRLWDSIPEQWGHALSRPDPESLASSPACTDGIDNDFDRRIDSGDPGCSDTPPSPPALPPHWTVDKADSPKPPQGYRLIPGR